LATGSPAEAHTNSQSSYCGHGTTQEYFGFWLVNWEHSHNRVDGSHYHIHHYLDADSAGQWHYRHKMCGYWASSSALPPVPAFDPNHPEPVIPEDVVNEHFVL
jgi:hypothetical protein